MCRCNSASSLNYDLFDFYDFWDTRIMGIKIIIAIIVQTTSAASVPVPATFSRRHPTAADKVRRYLFKPLRPSFKILPLVA